MELDEYVKMVSKLSQANADAIVDLNNKMQEVIDEVNGDKRRVTQLAELCATLSGTVGEVQKTNIEIMQVLTIFIGDYANVKSSCENRNRADVVSELNEKFKEVIHDSSSHLRIV